jgi:hypothetical protein
MLSRRPVIFVLAISAVLSFSVAATVLGQGEKADGPLRWQGTWNNRKYGTNGPLRCTAASKDANTWEAKFEGTGVGRPFTYNVNISTMKKGNRTLLQGTSSISGDMYQWTGYVEGKTLFGRYRSSSGNNGEFRLQEAR